MNIIFSRSLHKAIYMDNRFEKGYFIINGDSDEKPYKRRHAMLRMLTTATIVALALMQISCPGNNGGNPADSGVPGGTLASSYPYIATVSTIVLTVNKNVCDVDTLKHVADMTLTYQLNGDTLFLTGGNIPGVASSESSGSGIVVLVRQGHGSGLVGNWQWVGGKDSASAPVDTTMSSLMNYMVTQFTATQMSTYNLKSTADIWYDTYVAMFAMLPGYHITVAKPTDTTVTFAGGISGEVMKITCPADNQSLIYSSTNPLHQTYTYYANPTSCPNTATPDWYIDFLVANIQAAVPKQAGTDHGVKSLKELPGRLMRNLF